MSTANDGNLTAFSGCVLVRETGTWTVRGNTVGSTLCLLFVPHFGTSSPLGLSTSRPQVVAELRCVLGDERGAITHRERALNDSFTEK